MKKSSLFFLVLLVFSVLSIGVFADEIPIHPPEDDLSAFLDEVSEFHQDVDSRLNEASEPLEAPETTEASIASSELPLTLSDSDALLSISVNILAVILGAICALGLILALFR